MMIFFLLLTQFAFAEPPDLVAPVRKQQLSPLINCALDAEGLKCWLQDGGMFDDVKGQPRVIKRTGVVDFQLSEGGKYACWHTEKTVTCVASYYRGNPSPNPPYWLALNQVSQLQLISRQATTPLVCLHDTEASGRQREICAWMDGGWEEHVRYLEDKWNDGPAFSACEMDRYLGKLRANGSFEIGQFFDSLGIAHKEAAPIKVELESYYQHHSRWHPDPSGGWAEEWNSCNANYSLTLPSFTKDKQHDFPVNCETLLPTLKSTLPVFGCQKNPRARLSPLRERRNLLREVSFDEDWPDALKLLARERDMYNVQVQPGDHYHRALVNFTDRSGKQKLSLAFSYDGFWAEDFSRKLSSFAAFHLFYDEQNKQYQIYDRGWKLLPLKEGERSESRRFIVEKQTYVCLEMDCYRVSQ